VITIQPISTLRAIDALAVKPSDPCRQFFHGDLASPTKWGRWSYATCPASLSLRCDPDGQAVTLRSSKQVIRTWDDPLAALKWMADTVKERQRPGPPFKGGWVGWINYDLGRLFEKLPARAADRLGLPLFQFTYHAMTVAMDGVKDEAFLVQGDDLLADELGFDDLFATPGISEPGHGPLRCNFTRDAYESAVQKALDYIAAGDVFQVNLSQRFTVPLPDAPAAIYKKLLAKSPSWFGAYLGYDDYALLCNSPELFFQVTPENLGATRRIVTRPIKGTRPRLPKMKGRLESSEKDLAELTMIVDLERNDLGKICEVGSVKVIDPRTIETHPGVYHGAATVEGLLRSDVRFVDILRAMFPGGSVTGVPKIRAMEIIEELEPVRRGPYCGAVGYLSTDGHISFNIAIRTMIAREGDVHISVGGGIVADSKPADEYEETLVKAKAMLAALGIERPV